jgi:hypothetical protein
MWPNIASADAGRMKTETLARWMGIGAQLLVALGFFAALILHVGLHLSWNTLAFPCASFVAVQIASYAAIAWAWKYKNMRIVAPVVGAYWVGSGSIVIHYSLIWGLHTGLGDHDLWGFNAFIVALVLGLVLMPRRWTDEYFADGVRCSRCHHHHEGHDCNCGCRTDQFKYPVLGI